MGLFDFLRRSKPTGTTAPASPVVAFDDEGVTCTRSSGLRESVRWSDLRAVLIKTTADGPAVDDLFWVLVGRNSGCVVPNEAQGCDRLLERLQQLPGFDNRAVIQASSCIEEQSFLCWERQEPG